MRQGQILTFYFCSRKPSSRVPFGHSGMQRKTFGTKNLRS